MPNNKINAVLTKNESEDIVIRFAIADNEMDLNLQSDNSEEIKKVFLELANQIKVTPVEIELTRDESIDEKTDGLFIDASDTYIKQLNTEMLSLENDEDLKKIRAFQE